MRIKLPTVIAALAYHFLAFPAGCRAVPTTDHKPLLYDLIEAESAPQGAVKADPEASGGQYVAREGAYQPLLTVEMPPASGDAFVIWARVRGTALQLKGVAADGKQRELNWVWDKPTEWKWVSFGRHARAELGAKMLLMQGTDPRPDAGLDAVVLAADDSFSPDALALALPPLPPVAVTVHWRKPVARATSLSYGLNAFGGFSPDTTRSAVYEANMTAMSAGLLRLHNWRMMNDSQTDPSGWIDTARRRWDVEKIKKALSGAYGYGPALLINIPGWPAWMDRDKDGFLDADQTQAYADFCADLVRIVNRGGATRRVLYWEATNERDDPYFVQFHADGGRGPLKDPAKPDRVADLAAIYNACAVAMKAADPSIQVGGPAMARPDLTDFVRRFAQATAPHLDFFSFHAYASGSKEDTDRQIFDRTGTFGGATKEIVGILRAASPRRPIPTFLDEYNISWTWETRDPRMTDVKGAVFDALTLVSAVTNGVDATCAWNEKDGIYGKMDDAFQPRPGLTTFRLFNRYLVGDVVEAASADPQSVVAYAVQSAAPGRKSLLLINRSPHDRTVTLKSQDWTLAGAKPWTLCTLTKAGDKETSTQGSQWASSPILLPADSLTLFTQQLR